MLVADEPGEHFVGVQFTPASPCTSRCDMPTTVDDWFVVDLDAASRRAEAAVAELALGAEVETTQDYPLQPGEASLVGVTLRLPPAVDLRDLDEVSIELQPGFGGEEPDPVPIETEHPYDSTITSHLLVTPS